MLEKWKFASIFVLIVVVAGYVPLWYYYTNKVQDSYQLGYADGNDNGYQLGYASGSGDGYQLGYSKGYTEGNYSGYQDGNTIGYETGYQVGLHDGNETGFNNGYIQGNLSGYERGKTTGYNRGYQIGFYDGHRVGYQEGFYNGNETGYEAGYVQGVEDGVGRGYNIRDPTYQEALNFIASDKTDQNEYSDNYTCFNFANDVICNAFKDGYECGFVYVEFPDSAHAIVCFNTTNYGLVYIEPQTDKIVTVTIGFSYWEQNGYGVPTDYDDTIVYVAIIW
jgi:hypothetical protein